MKFRHNIVSVGGGSMSKEDYREKIEEHRQSIDIEKPNSRQSRSRATKNKKPKRKDPLMTILTVIFIFIPLAVLVYIWGFYSPTTPSQAQDKDESVEYEKNDNLEEKETTIEEQVIKDDTEDENKEDDDQSEEYSNDSKQEDQNKEEPKTTEQEDNGQAQNNEQSQDNEYVVKTGDTLYRIATNHNRTVDEIMAANGLRSENIQVGQTLIIP